MKVSKIIGASIVKSLALQLRISVIALASFAILCCGVYPLIVWGLGQVFFPQKANGSLITRDGKVVGASLIAQGFSASVYFHPRPSAAGGGYDAAGSGGSNLGPTSRQLIDTVAERVARYRAENGLSQNDPVPADAVTTSASGLDPHISLQNALIQARRVAQARGMSEAQVRNKVEEHVEEPDLGLFGERRVNVLLLNLDLDGNG